MKIVILGGPGSGKKTQTGLLADHYQLSVLTVNELVKQALADESEHGLQLQGQHQTGQPVGDDILLSLLQQRLSRPDVGEGFILDGFPRNLLQALTLDELLNELGLSLDCILLFEVETDALMERLVGRRTCRSCGTVYNVYTQPTVVEDVCDRCGGRLHQRADDTEETVSSRLHVFDHLTGPLLSHYGKQGKVLRVDGEGEVAEVFARTCRMLDRFLDEQATRQVVAEPSADPYPPAAAVPDRTVVSPQTNGSATILNELEEDFAQADGKENPSTKKSDAAKRSLPTTDETTAPVKSSAAGKKRVQKGAVAAKGANKATKPSVKKGAKKRPLAAKATAKTAVKKKTAPKKSAAGKGKSGSAVKSRIVKQAAKKPLTKKKTTRKPVAKQAVNKAGVKKTSAGKPKAAKKAAKKQAVGKSKTTKKVVKKPIVGKSKTPKKTAKKPVVGKSKTVKKAAKKTTVGRAKRAKQAVKKPAAGKSKSAKKVNKKQVAGKPKTAKRTAKKPSAGKPKTSKKAIMKSAAKRKRAKGSLTRR